MRGVEQEDSETVTPWKEQYLDIPMSPILDASEVDITDKYSLNDASAADLGTLHDVMSLPLPLQPRRRWWNQIS